MIFDPYLPIPPILYGGTERVSSYLIEALMARGHEVVVFGPGNSTIACEIIPCSKTDVDIKRGFSPEYIKEVERKNVQNLLEREKSFDIIHWHAKPKATMAKFSTPILCTPHVTFKEYFTKEERDVVKKLSNKIYFSSVSKKFQKTNPAKYLASVYHGLPVDTFSLGLYPQGYISFIGRFSKDKQPHIAIKAALALDKKICIGARLDVFGQKYFDTYCKEYMQHPSVDFRGEVTDQEKITIFQHAEVNLHPIAIEEPFGLSVAEAGLCGTPTIAFDKGSMRELINNGVSGYIVKTFSELLSVYPKAVTLDRKKVREHFVQFNHLKMAKEYEGVYTKILEKENKNDKSIKSLNMF